MPKERNWEMESGRVTKAGVISRQSANCTCGDAFHLLNDIEQHLLGCPAVSQYEDDQFEDYTAAQEHMDAHVFDDDDYEYGDDSSHFEFDLEDGGAEFFDEEELDALDFELTDDRFVSKAECTWALEMFPEELDTQEGTILKWYTQGASSREIAYALDVTKETVEERLKSAKITMRKALYRYREPSPLHFINLAQHDVSKICVAFDVLFIGFTR